MYVRTYVWTYVRTEFLPILQDFVPCRGRCPKSHKKTEKMRPAQLRWQQGWMAGTRRLDTTRKEFSGKKITFPCLLSSRRVDDVPPRAKAVIVDAQNSMTQPKSRDTLTRHRENDGREQQCTSPEK